VRPEAIKAIPLRHPWRWVSAVVVLALAGLAIDILATAPQLDWGVVGKYLFNPQILGGVIPGITAREQAALGASNAPAIEAGTAWANLIESATTRDELLGIREQAKAAGVNLDPALAARAEALGVAVKLETPADPNALWTQILAGTPDGWLTADLEIDFVKVTGVDCAVATADDMRRYLQAAKA